jgi:hypothetical protein
MSQEATGMDERMLMAIYSYQCEITENMVTKKKNWKKWM